MWAFPCKPFSYVVQVGLDVELGIVFCGCRALASWDLADVLWLSCGFIPNRLWGGLELVLREGIVGVYFFVVIPRPQFFLCSFFIRTIKVNGIVVGGTMHEQGSHSSVSCVVLGLEHFLLSYRPFLFIIMLHRF